MIVDLHLILKVLLYHVESENLSEKKKSFHIQALGISVEAVEEVTKQLVKEGFLIPLPQRDDAYFITFEGENLRLFLREYLSRKRRNLNPETVFEVEKVRTALDMASVSMCNLTFKDWQMIMLRKTRSKWG
ncbi:MAG: hypothetical protein Q4C70_12450 [Planctomycetia bacterium]|nr:hypothetical protein [Planctomycetia bacterium]